MSKVSLFCLWMQRDDVTALPLRQAPRRKELVLLSEMRVWQRAQGWMLKRMRRPMEHPHFTTLETGFWRETTWELKKIYHVCFLLAFKAHQQKPVFSRAPSTVRLSCCNLGGGGGGWYVMINLECTSSVLSTRSGDEATSGQKMSERL